MRALLGDRRFLLLLTGQVTSMAGDSVLLIVLAIWVKALTGSSGLASVVILAINLPALVAPLLGWAVDRFRRRSFLIWLNLASAAALLPMYAVHGRGGIWIVYLVALGYGLSGSLNSAALAGLIKEVVAEPKIAEANGLLRSIQESLRLLGPLAGAGLYAWAGISSVVAFDMATFGAAAATLVAIRVRETPPERYALHWAAEAGAGFRFLFGYASLRRSALALGAGFLVFGMVTPGVFAYVGSGLHRAPTFVGVLLTAMGLGSVAGALLSPRMIHRSGEQATMAAGLLAMALGSGLMVYPRLWLGLVGGPVAGFGVAVTTVAFSTLRQRATPAALMGRVATATDLLVVAPQTLSIAIGAVIVSVVDFRWLFALAAVSLLVAGTSLRAMRWKDARAASAPGSSPGPTAVRQDEPQF
jgi:MFS family permease